MKRRAWLAFGALALHGCTATPESGTATPESGNANATGNLSHWDEAGDRNLLTSATLPTGFSRHPEEDARRAFKAERIAMLDVGIESSNLPGWEDPNANPGQCKDRLYSRSVPELAKDVIADLDFHLAGMRYVHRYHRELRRLCRAAPIEPEPERD